MFVVIVKANVKPEKVETYESTFKALREKVLANEPGVTFYELSRVPDSPCEYRMVEAYRDAQVQEEHSKDERDEDRDRSDDELGHATAKQVHGDIDRRHVYVFEGLVVFAIIDHCPGDTRHHRADIYIEGVPQVHVGEDRRFEITLGDDAVHDYQDGSGRDGLDERIDSKQEGIGPVRFDLPAQPGCRTERAPESKSGGPGFRLS